MTDNAWIKMLLWTLILCLALLACSPAPVAQPPTATPAPLDLVKALEAAGHRDDADAAMALFVDEGLEYSRKAAHRDRLGPVGLALQASARE